MSDTEPNISAHLATLPEVTALIADRAYLLQIPQQHRASAAAYPCVVFLTPATTRDGEMCGTSDVPAAQIQIDCYGTDADQVRALGRAIRRGIVDYSGPMGSVTVQRAQISADFDGLDPDPGLYRRTLLFNLWYVET